MNMTWTRTDIRTTSLALADAFLHGEWHLDAMHRSVVTQFGEGAPWTAQLADALLDAYTVKPIDRPREVAKYIELVILDNLAVPEEDDEETDDEDWSEDEWSDGDEPSFEELDDIWATVVESDGPGPDPVEVVELPRIGLPPAPPKLRGRIVSRVEMVASRWDVPRIDGVQNLASFLRLGVTELQWVADPRSLERSAPDPRMRNYHYVWVVRPHGAPRLLEAPKGTLKGAQRRVLRRILDAIPPHEAAHGFRRGHSAVTHARRHTERDVVIRFDLEDFFASIGAGRVFGIFRSAGYAEPVAHLLTAMCTNAVPGAELQPLAGEDDVGKRHRLRTDLAVPHLPQGAPTSPALANLVAYRLDIRLANLATSLGGAYSRYADDLVISGDRTLLHRAPSIRRLVEQIVEEEGFRLNVDKTRVLTRSGRQSVTGIVVNDGLNVTRADYDRLKATLHDAAINGPAVANRLGVEDFRSHLLGRISWVRLLKPARAAKLETTFERIDWKSQEPRRDILGA